MKYIVSLSATFALLNLSAPVFGVRIQRSLRRPGLKGSRRPATQKRRAQEGKGKSGKKHNHGSDAIDTQDQDAQDQYDQDLTQSPADVHNETSISEGIEDVLAEYDHPLEGPIEDVDPRVDEFRTVQIAIVGSLGKCVGFNSSLSMPLTIVDCSSTGDLDYGVLDHWEVIQSAATTDLFLLRHSVAQECIPLNPESPSEQFDCFADSGAGIAIADTVNGLVNCATPFAAELGFTDSVNNMYLYSNSCTHGVPGNDTDVVLMSYTTDEDAALVLWGEKVLLGMNDLVAAHALNGNWILLDVVPV